MSTLTVDFQFSVGQKVIIRALDRPAVVRLVRFDGNLTDFFVSWWDEGKRQSEWLHVDELCLPRAGDIRP